MRPRMRASGFAMAARPTTVIIDEIFAARLGRAATDSTIAIDVPAPRTCRSSRTRCWPRTACASSTVPVAALEYLATTRAARRRDRQHSRRCRGEARRGRPRWLVRRWAATAAIRLARRARGARDRSCRCGVDRRGDRRRRYDPRYFGGACVRRDRVCGCNLVRIRLDALAHADVVFRVAQASYRRGTRSGSDAESKLVGHRTSARAMSRA